MGAMLLRPSRVSAGVCSNQENWHWFSKNERKQNTTQRSRWSLVLFPEHGGQTLINFLKTSFASLLTLSLPSTPFPVAPRFLIPRHNDFLFSILCRPSCAVSFWAGLRRLIKNLSAAFSGGRGTARARYRRGNQEVDDELW